MSTFTDKKKWADADSDSSDGEEENEESPVQKQEETVVETAQEEENDDNSSEESDSDADDTEKLDLSKVVQAAPVAKKEVKQLTKKERKELKQQELNDLDSILAEFGSLQPASAETNTNTSTTPLSTAEEGDANNEAKKDKKKKKKPTAAKKAEAPAVGPEDESFVPAADISAVLKSRSGSGKKSGSKTATMSDAQKIALADLKATAEGSKKKRDKSKFCEGTY